MTAKKQSSRMAQPRDEARQDSLTFDIRRMSSDEIVSDAIRRLRLDLLQAGQRGSKVQTDT
jgi:hypothetical protein